MRVAALYDVHGNLPALEAVLQDIRQAGVDHVVVGGDVVPGPMPRETLEMSELGEVLFCHATPQNDTDVFTRLTPEDRLLPVFEGVNVSVVICGHTHMQFDRLIGRIRVVNAGSVGMPYGKPGAHWLLLGPGVELRHTAYDLAKAAERMRGTQYPQAQGVAQNVLKPPSEEEILEVFTKVELR